MGDLTLFVPNSKNMNQINEIDHNFPKWKPTHKWLMETIIFVL